MSLSHPTYPGTGRPILIGDRVTYQGRPAVVCDVMSDDGDAGGQPWIRADDAHDAELVEYLDDLALEGSVNLTVCIPGKSLACLLGRATPFGRHDIQASAIHDDHELLVAALEAVRLAVHEQAASE